MKEIGGGTENWKNTSGSCSWIGRMNTSKISILPKAIYRFSTISINIEVGWMVGTGEGD